MRGNFRGDAAAILDASQATFGDAPDHDGIQPPLLENGKNFVLAAFLRDQQHALLRFAEHDFVRRHAGFALRNFGEIDLDAGAAARSHFHGGAGEPGSTHVLNGHYRAGLHGFEAGFEKQFFHEGIADLDIGALLPRFFGEFGGGEQRCAVNAIATGLCANVNHRIAGTFGFGEEQIFFTGDAQSQRVDEWVLRIAGLEGDFTANSRDAEAISIAADAADDAVEDAAILCGLFFSGALARDDLAKTQRIEHGDGARAHGENVAQDSADAGGGALERLDVTGMIVRFNLEGRDEAVADVHDTGVFSGALHDQLAARRQALQVHLARFVGTMLAPHHAEDAQLGDVRLAA